MPQTAPVREYDIATAVRHLGMVRVGHFLLVYIGIVQALGIAIAAIRALVIGDPTVITSLWFWAMMLVGLGGFYSLYHYPSLIYRERHKLDFVVFFAVVCLSAYVVVGLFSQIDALERQLRMAGIFRKPPQIEAIIQYFVFTASGAKPD